MRKITEIPSTQDGRPMELWHLRVAAYCRVVLVSDIVEEANLFKPTLVPLVAFDRV